VRTPHLIDVTFVELGEHEQPDRLRETLRQRLVAADAVEPAYDAILLLFGLCGNATVGLRAGRVPLVMPRAHDCATILLGSREAFRRQFADRPSQPFGSIGYVERGNDYMLKRPEGLGLEQDADYAAYVAQYGEENARYIWETLRPEHMERHALFIAAPEIERHATDLVERFRGRALAAGQTYEHLTGSLRLIEALIMGTWTDEEFLVVPPGQRIAGVYDWDVIARAETEGGAAPST
jgi:hypothetical protein